MYDFEGRWWCWWWHATIYVSLAAVQRSSIMEQQKTCSISAAAISSSIIFISFIFNFISIYSFPVHRVGDSLFIAATSPPLAFILRASSLMAATRRPIAVVCLWICHQMKAACVACSKKWSTFWRNQDSTQIVFFFFEFKVGVLQPIRNIAGGRGRRRRRGAGDGGRGMG